MCDLCVLSIVLKIGVVIVPRIRILDASTEEYQEEEEEVHFQGEEDHFDQYTNQGKLYYCKLTPMQALLLQDNTLAKCKAHQEQGITLFILCS